MMKALKELKLSSEDNLPKWLEKTTLKKAIKAQIGEYKEISNLTVNKCAMDGGGNSLTDLLRIKAEVALEDGSEKTAAFILKVHHDNSAMSLLTARLRLFPKEEEMYYKILPKFEELYLNAGKVIKFAPKAFTFDRDLGEDYVLLEDLQAKQYRNANRCQGLDMEHMKQVLKKMAELHAASACYVEHYGVFGDDFSVGIYTEKNRQLLNELYGTETFLKQLKKWKSCQKYFEKLSDAHENLVDRLLQDQSVNWRQFNVLNHGDLWTNNIMFQYDSFGKIKQTLLVDFQACKYGSPACDLYYCILSSATKNIKTTQFEYMIRYYYDRLIENLKLLQYHRPLPKLKNIHEAMFRNGLAAYLVVSKVLPLVMVDYGGKANQKEDKLDLYGNYKYCQVMMELLPWLDNRGLLDWQ